MLVKRMMTSLGLIFLLGCTTTSFFTEKDLPKQGCIIHREAGNVQYERVIVLHEHEEMEWEVTYPDSNNPTSTYFVRKEKVSFVGCPFIDAMPSSIDIEEKSNEKQ